jgi:hypothetical protein
LITNFGVGGVHHSRGQLGENLMIANDVDSRPAPKGRDAFICPSEQWRRLQRDGKVRDASACALLGQKSAGGAERVSVSLAPSKSSRIPLQFRRANKFQQIKLCGREMTSTKTLP